MMSTALNAARRTADLTALADGEPTDVVVIGGGITGVMRDAPLLGDDRESLVRQIVTVADLLRRDELVMSVLHSQLAPIYITERLGASQQMLIDALAERLRVAQRHGSVRAGDPLQMATVVLLITQSTIQSEQIVRPILDADALATELAYSLNGYLS